MGKILSPNVEHIKCEICGSDEYSIVFKGIPDENKDVVNEYKSSGNLVGNDQVVKCKQCGLIYVNPRLKPELIFGGYSEGSDETFVSQAKGRELTFAKCLKLIEKYTKGQRGKILDIGTAGGSFLHVAKQKGWEVYGLEPNKWLCNWGKQNYGIDIKPGDLFKQNYESNFFDVVTLWDVLEHTPNPKQVLEECNRILKPGGMIVVNYPDIGSLLARGMGRKWIFILTVHLFYFTPKTIKKILARTGFKSFKLKPHIQRLSLGYLVYRMEAYSKAMNKLGKTFVNMLHLGNMQIPYWLGQTLVFARKEKDLGVKARPELAINAEIEKKQEVPDQIKSKKPGKVMILGGGVSGLASGYKLAQSGYDISVLEKTKVVGGISTSFQKKDYMLDYGPHKIYTQMPKIMQEIKNLIGEENLLKIPKKSRVRLVGKYFDYPVGIKSLVLGMNPLIGLKCGLGVGMAMLKKNKNEVSYEDYLVNRFGRGVYEMVFGQYARKVWGDPKQLAKVLAETRVPVKSALDMAMGMVRGNKGDPATSADFFYYPKKGIKELPLAMGKKIIQNNGQVLLETRPESIIIEDSKVKQIIYKKGDQRYRENVDFCISTIPIEELPRLLEPKAPARILEAANNLKYRSLILLYIVVNKDRLFSDNWIFYPEEEFIFNRVSEQKGFSPSMIPKGKTVLTVEITASPNSETFKAENETIFQKALADLEKANILKKEEVLEYFVLKRNRVYPIYNLEFEKNLNTILSYLHRIENLVTNGRMGLFNYNNMDHCMDMGFIAANHVIQDKKQEEWVKSREYFNTYRIVD